MAQAALHRKKLPFELAPTIYRLLEAKFSAETATGVGKPTSVTLFRNDGQFVRMTNDEVEAVRKIWEKISQTPDPPKAIASIKESGAFR